MSGSEVTKSISMIAAAAFLAGDFGKLVEVTADNTVGIVDGLLDRAIGVLAEAPISAGEVAPIVLLEGRVKIQAGGTIAAGSVCIPAADGQVTSVATVALIPSGAMGVGIALTGGVDGDIIEMLGMPLSSQLTA